MGVPGEVHFEEEENGNGRKYKQCHEEFDHKIEGFRKQGHVVPTHKMIKTPEQVALIKESAKVNVEVLDTVAEKICAGMSTEDIDKIVYEVTTKRGAIPGLSRTIMGGRREPKTY